MLHYSRPRRLEFENEDEDDRNTPDSASTPPLTPHPFLFPFSTAMLPTKISAESLAVDQNAKYRHHQTVPVHSAALQSILETDHPVVPADLPAQGPWRHFV